MEDKSGTYLAGGRGRNLSAGVRHLSAEGRRLSDVGDIHQQRRSIYQLRTEIHDLSVGQRLPAGRKHVTVYQR